MLNSLDFGKEFDSQALSETSNDANSIKHPDDQINELENKQLNDENRTLSEVIKLIHENKCITGNKSRVEDDTNKWEVAKLTKNKTNKNISNPESVGVTNKF